MAKRRTRTQTALFELIQNDLGEDLDQWLAAQRQAGDTWDDITRHLMALTGRRFSRESVRVWYERAHPPSKRKKPR